MKKSTPRWCEDCRFVCFETGLRKPMLTLNDPNCLKNTTNVYSIHLELWRALPCQISTGKWKYVNPCQDFLGIPDQRTAYVKRQVRPGWTFVDQVSPPTWYIDAGPAGISHSQGNRGCNLGINLTKVMETTCFVIQAAYPCTGLLACDLTSIIQ